MFKTIPMRTRPRDSNPFARTRAAADIRRAAPATTYRLASMTRASACVKGMFLKAALSFCLLLSLACANDARAQSSKLPAPERIVADYVKASGGKSRLAALRDATYEWDVQSQTHAAGRMRALTKSPSSVRSELIYDGGGQVVSAVNPRMAWQQTPNLPVQTLTGDEAFTAKLQAMLGASRFVDYKRQKVLARTVGVEQVGDEQAYVVEFSTRAGGRLRYWFGASSRLLLKTEDPGGGYLYYTDYRPENGIMESHRTTHETGGKTDATYTLRSVRYNAGLTDSLFEPPSDSTLDIPALLRRLSKNQDEDDRRVNDYTFTQKVTERELNDSGALKKEKVTVYEVYPFVDYGWVRKLVSEDGVPLAPERAAKEEKRVGEELEKAEREAPKNKEKRERRRAERKAKQKSKGGGADSDEDDDVGISTFLRAAEFVSPRRERFHERDVIVFDFRPRAGFKPSTQGESIVSKLSGVIWVDPAEQQVVRLEARLVDNYKVGGGLLASIKQGSAFVFEQTRLPDGVWLPRFTQVNASARVMLFAGMSVNRTEEFGDYKRFSTKAGEEKLDAPKEKP